MIPTLALGYVLGIATAFAIRIINDVLWFRRARRRSQLALPGDRVVRRAR